MIINSLSNDKVVDMSKMKAFTGNKSNLMQKLSSALTLYHTIMTFNKKEAL